MIECPNHSCAVILRPADEDGRRNSLSRTTSAPSAGGWVIPRLSRLFSFFLPLATCHLPPRRLLSLSLSTASRPLSTSFLFSLRLSAFICGFILCSSASATIRYTVSLAQPDQHLFRITMEIPDVHDSLTVSLPAWNALYQIRDFAHHILDVRAIDAQSRVLPISKLDNQTWRVSSSGSVTLYYTIYWDENGPFASQLNSTHAFLNLAMVLFYVPDRRSEDVAVVFIGLQLNWRVAVALKSVPRVPSIISGPRDQLFTAHYISPSYDALVDAPVEIGPFEEFRLEGITPPVRVAVHGENYDRAQLADALRRIVTYETGLMGGAPYDEYLFLLHYGQPAVVGGGGMEHSNSTAISAFSLANAIDVGAHEFFHLWNVKRIRPALLEPVDYSREQFTRSLWFAEGVTSTYGSYTLVRTGLWTGRQFYEDLANEITTLEARPAHTWQSVEQSSLDTWFDKYPLYRRPEFSISYYNKGQIIGVLLDIFLRDQSDNRASLDDVLRHLNENFARRNRPYLDSDLLAASRAVLSRFASNFSRASFLSLASSSSAHTLPPSPLAPPTTLDDFFSRYVSGTDPLDYDFFLAQAGLKLNSRPRRASNSSPQQLFYEIEELPNATDKQRRIRDGLLRGTTDSPR